MSKRSVDPKAILPSPSSNYAAEAEKQRAATNTAKKPAATPRPKLPPGQVDPKAILRLPRS